MRSIKTAACAVALSAVLWQTAYGAQTVPTNMAGNVGCAGYLKARMERKTVPFELWLSGYLTGLATYDKRINNLSKLQVANGETGTLLLESYCKTHPQETFQIAAREMARSVFYGRDR